MKDLLLCIDIGNTNIVLGGYRGEELLFISRIATDRLRTGDQYAVELRDILLLNGVDPEEFEGAMLSSVVPSLSMALSFAAERVLGVKPLQLIPGIKTGLNIRIDNPAETGPDLVAAAVAAKAKYPLPIIVIDMGTATTITVVNKKGDFIGGAIMPGLRVSLDALVGKTSLLTGIALSAPDKAIGTNTADCMRSGAVFGMAGMIDSLCERFKAELGEDATVVATGGLCPVIVPNCSTEITVDDHLLVEGLRLIYERNR